jgi:hypothetical protein
VSFTCRRGCVPEKSKEDFKNISCIFYTGNIFALFCGHTHGKQDIWNK